MTKIHIVDTLLTIMVRRAPQERVRNFATKKLRTRYYKRGIENVNFLIEQISKLYISEGYEDSKFSVRGLQMLRGFLVRYQNVLQDYL